MLGTLADAEDAVQEGYARWYRLPAGERAEVRSPGAWLTRTVSRICLDMLGSARARHELYVGEWLPEPLPASTTSTPPDPLERVQLDGDVGFALLVVLESLTPAERVAFVLHEVFAVPFDEIAEVLERSPAAARQLASSARRHVAERRGGDVDRGEHAGIVREFFAAARSGDLARLVALLAPAAVVTSDGGGKVTAARHPVVGADRVARFLLGILEKNARPDTPTLSPSLDTVSGAPGIVFRDAAGAVQSTVSTRIVDGRIADVWIMLNPDKLTAWR